MIYDELTAFGDAEDSSPDGPGTTDPFVPTPEAPSSQESVPGAEIFNFDPEPPGEPPDPANYYQPNDPQDAPEDDGADATDDGN